MCVWEVETGDCLQVTRGHRAAVRVLQECAGVLVSGAYNGSVGFLPLSQVP